MVDLNFDDSRVLFTPICLYTEHINLQFADYLKNHYKEITPRDFTYLSNIFYHQNISQKELSELLFVSESNVAQIIKRLERNNLIIRRVDENNKRRKIINLTELGRSITLSLLKEIYEFETDFFKDYSPEETELFKKMLYGYYFKAIEII